ncbi:MAG: ABC transporter permease [Cellulophaga sp.]
MFKNHIKLAYRNLVKNKMLSLINLTGLTLGLACIMTLVFVVYAYYNADGFIEQEEEVYYLKTFTTSGHDYAQTPHPLLAKIKASCPDIVAATHSFGWNVPWLSYKDVEIQEETTNYVEPDFLKVYTLPLKYGDPDTALQNKYDVVLTSTVSEKFFGDTNPVGKTIISNDTLSLKVAGVLEPLSPYSSLRISVLLSTELLADNVAFKEYADWGNTFSGSFLRLRPDTDIQKLEGQILDLAKQNYTDPTQVKTIKLMPYTGFREDMVPIAKIIIKGSIAIIGFVLLIVLVNLLNLNSSVMYDRTKQLAVRKILGSNKISIVQQFCIENGILVFISLISSSILFFLVLLPEVNKNFGGDFGDISLRMPKDYPFILYYVGLGAFIALVVGIIPTLRYISLPIATAIKGKIDAAKNNFIVRNAFITLQFTLAILFICVAIVLNRQIDFMQDAPVGYTQENIVAAKINLAYKNPETAESKFSVILDKLKTNPAVLDFSTTQMVPSTYFRSYTLLVDTETNRELRIRYANTDAHYLKTLDISVPFGRDFKDELSATESNSIIINNKAMKAFGWTNLHNKRLNYKGSSESYKVVGVTEDFHYQDMQNPIEPLVHFYKGKQRLGSNNYLMLKIVPGKEKQVLQELEKDFAQIESRRNFEHELLAVKVNSQYDLLKGILKTVNFVAFFTILISCLGMFGLISLIAKKRVKEIGIRKVLGASIAKILMLLSKDFIVLVVLASCIAIPLGWWVMNNWLQSFAYSISITWWMLALSGLLALLIVSITVGIQSVKAALANPVKSLRTE